MIRFLLLFLRLTNSIKCGVLLSHDRYLQSHGITCGTALDSTSQSSNARVLNGEKVSNKQYPWLAEIRRLLIATNGVQKLDKCNGVIISRHAILTAGHCLCNDNPDLRDEHRVKLLGAKITCRKDFNLNKKAYNQIDYSIGTQRMALDRKHNARVEAYLFDYDPAGTFFSRNGDMGIVIDKHGLPLIQYQANPICLPEENSFVKSPSERYTGVEVTLAGRGKRFIDSGRVDINGNPITSCLTNEGRDPYGNRMNFQQCKPLEHPPSDPSASPFCVDVPVTQDLITSEVDVTFGVRTRIDLPTKETCQKYWDKALKAYGKANKIISPPETLIHDAHRIILRNQKIQKMTTKFVSIGKSCRSMEYARQLSLIGGSALALVECLPIYQTS